MDVICNHYDPSLALRDDRLLGKMGERNGEPQDKLIYKDSNYCGSPFLSHASLNALSCRTK
jgi:hypothetical protein